MGKFIIIFQFTKSHMGIDLRGSQRGVPQQFLHAVELSAVVEHAAGKGVAQHMRAQFAAPAHLRQRVVHNVVNDRRIQLPPFGGDKECVGGARLAVAQSTVVLDECAQLLANGHNAVLVALAQHLDGRCLKIHIGIAQPYQLGTPDARLIEHHHHQAVANRHKVGGIERCVEQGV